MFNFDIKAAIDILLVAILLYYVWKVMKQSRAANIFNGIMIFVVVWVLLSRVFELQLIGSILDNLMSIGALALVVLFAEEIRHFFSTIGSQQNTRHIFTFFKNKKQDHSHRTQILPIVMACLSMSRQKIGALIVIERNVGLGEYIESGENIDATISQRLIENIFFKNSPLHDGAIIISQGRLKAAGCILPVSHNVEIPKHLGLRHRSALGISEKSDCIAICVSEETGEISIANERELRLGLSYEELEQELTRNWVDQ